MNAGTGDREETHTVLCDTEGNGAEGRDEEGEEEETRADEELGAPSVIMGFSNADAEIDESSAAACA